MKLRSLRVLILAVLLPVSWTLRGQTSESAMVINESFEDGIPDGWTQVHEFGSLDWKVEQGGAYPTGAYHESNRLVFRNETGQTQGWRTKLVTPVLDLSMQKIQGPVLVIAHAQEKMTGDFDTLTIWFRRDDKARWQVLKKFDSYISMWQVDTIALPQANATYQLAFEGSDNYGRGVVIDNVIIMPDPTCMQPSNIMATGLTNTTADFFWLAGGNIEGSNVKISTEQLTEEQLLDADFEANVLDTFVKGKITRLSVDKLVSGEKYWFYVQAVCPEEKSLWSDGLEFRTKTLAELPFRETFDTVYTGYVSRKPNWTFVSDGEHVPYNNTNMRDDDLAQLSPDATVSLIIGTERNGGYIDIPGRIKAYAASPQLVVDDLSEVQVKFYAAVGYYTGNLSKMYIGAMTNPEDHNTFVKVDSVEFYHHYSMEEFLVSFRGHDEVKDCKYIAFMSDFEYSNHISVDDIRVWIPEDEGLCPEPAGIKISVPSSKEIKVSWDLAGADHGEVIVSKTPVRDFDAVDATSKKSTTQGVSTVSFTELEEWTRYYIYVCNVTPDGKRSVWSREYSVLTPQSRPTPVDGTPVSFDFEASPNDPTAAWEIDPYENNRDGYAPIGIQGFRNMTGTTPMLVSAGDSEISKTSEYEIRIAVSTYLPSVSYMIMPDIDGLEKCRAVFWARNSSGDSDIASFEAGVMDDANDIKTFVPLDTISMADKKWRRYAVNLNSYKGDGRFLAFRMVHDGIIEEYLTVTIDNLKIEEIPTCPDPTNVTITPDESTAEITWDNTGADSWEVRVCAGKLKYDEIESVSQDTFKVVSVTGNKALVSGLVPGLNTYYAWIRPVCGGERGDWTMPYEFQSTCLKKNPIPYTLDFEEYQTTDGYSSRLPYVPIPCVDFGIVTNSDGLITSPVITPTTYEGKRGMNINGSAECSWIALPVMDAEVTDLQVSFRFMSWSSGGNPQIRVGVMSDPTDSTTFETVNAFRPDGYGIWTEVICPLAGYKGTGKHITIMAHKVDDAPDFYVDIIDVRGKAECQKVYGMAARDVTSRSAIVAWDTDGDEEEWFVVVGERTYSQEELEQIMAGTFEGDVAFSGYVKDNPYNVVNLEPNTYYFAYARAVCDKERPLYGSWNNTPAQFKTACEPIVPGENLFTFDDNGEGAPSCWTVKGAECQDEYAHDGSLSLRISTTSYAHTQSVACGDIADVEISFWGTAGENAFKADKNKKLYVGVLTSPRDMTTFTIVDTIFLYENWQYYTVRFDKYDGDDITGARGNYIMFSTEGVSNGVNVYIDDVTVDPVPDCTPAVVEIGVIDDKSVSFEFKEGNAPYHYFVTTEMIPPSELNASAPAGMQTTPAAEVTVADLEPNTDYYLYVSSTCEEGGYYWTAPTRFITNCKEVVNLPYKEDFDTYTYVYTGANYGSGPKIQPDCWQFFYDGDLIPFILADNAVAEGNCLSFDYDYVPDKSGVNYIVLPKVAEAIKDCQVGFKLQDLGWSSENQVRIVVGVTTDTRSQMAVDTTFVGVDTITMRSGRFTQVKVPMESYNGKEGNIALKIYMNSISDGSWIDYLFYIDEVEIRFTPECQMPLDPQVERYDDVSVTFSFTNDFEGKKFEYACGKSGFDPNGDGITPVQFTGETCIVTGLEPSTAYDFYVRTVCEESENMPYSDWVKFSQKTSEVPVKEYPYGSDLEKEKENWTTGGGEPEAYQDRWHVGTAFSQKEGGTSLYISSDGGKTASYNVTSASLAFAYRVLTLEAGDYTLEYDYYVTGDRYDANLYIALMPESWTFADGESYIFDEYGNSYTGMDDWNISDDERFILLAKQLYGSTEWRRNSHEVKITPELAGMYKLVFYWNNDIRDDYDPAQVSQPSAALENFNIAYDPCVPPINVTCSKVSESTADVSWISQGQPKYETWDIYLTQDYELQTPPATDSEDKGFVRHEEVKQTKLTLTGLDQNQPYRLFVRMKCDDGHSPWCEVPADFRTDCGPTEKGRTYSFEEAEGHEAYFEEYDEYRKEWTRMYIPECFNNGHSGSHVTWPSDWSGDAKELPYIVSGSGLARTGASALSIGTSRGHGGYISMPEVEGGYEGLQLTFWMRVFGVYERTGKVDGNGVDGRCANAVRVGTLTDLYDISTFEEIRNCEYPYTAEYIDKNTLMSSDPNGEDYWVKYEIPLSGVKGKYITFYDHDYAIAWNNVYIDDVTVEAINDKAAPYDLRFSDITSSSAHLSFSHAAGKEWTVTVATSRDLTEGVKTYTVTSGEHDLTGLDPQTRYYVRIAQTAAGAANSPVGMFTTAYETSFNNDFSEQITLPANWITFSGLHPDSVLNGTPIMTSSGDDAFRWSEGEGNVSPHMWTWHSHMDKEDEADRWLVTPAITLSTEHEADRAHLLFDLAINGGQDYSAPAVDQMSAAYNEFAVVVSDDAGLTWKRENAKIWSNVTEKGYPSFSSLPSDGAFHRMSVDMTEYMGKTVKVAFYTYSMDPGNLIFRIDNVHVNNVVDAPITDEICQFDDYNEFGFRLKDTELVEGRNEFTRDVYTDTEMPDTLYTLSLTMNPIGIYSYDAMMCEGETYTENGFNLTAGGTKRRKVAGAHGCDSIVEVRLTVNPIQHTMEFDTICQGAEVIWHGEKYDRAGTYYDTIPSTVTGCDSIVSLTLSVNGALEAKDTVTICHGGVYNFGKYGDLSTSGDYTDNFPNNGCDSIVHLHLIVLPELDTIINDLMCPGEIYQKNDYELDRPGTYPKTVPSMRNSECDSVVTLNLVQIAPDDVVEFEITIEEKDLPFTFFSKRFDKGTKPGSYTEDVEVSKEGCSGTVRLTLIVKENDVKPFVPDNEYGDRELYISPNPVKVGGEVKLDIELSAEERDGLAVNVYNAAGALVKSISPGDGEMIINCYFTPGVYVVRMTTGTGTQYQGKIIVQ